VSDSILTADAVLSEAEGLTLMDADKYKFVGLRLAPPKPFENRK